MTSPLRGEIWMIDLDPARGHEQAGTRPALIVSDDVFNSGPAGLVILLPLTSKPKGVRSHVALQLPEGGVRTPSFIKCEDVRSVAVERLGKRLGVVSPATMEAVALRLRILMDL
ncbi:MAG: type II toxin-antitoxin system PemK/MazF family toxin [Planctomycetia bacterium]|nr:type II toxin-antitoxin system PemK/MazF family toxin [Planctomycetia bacterium]